MNTLTRSPVPAAPAKLDWQAPIAADLEEVERILTRTLTSPRPCVARLVAQGHTNREVATQLFLTTNTIETHLRHVFQKLGVRSRTELASKFTDFRDSTAAPAA